MDAVQENAFGDDEFLVDAPEKALDSKILLVGTKTD
jgi:hypothetical protein